MSKLNTTQFEHLTDGIHHVAWHDEENEFLVISEENHTFGEQYNFKVKLLISGFEFYWTNSMWFSNYKVIHVLNGKVTELFSQDDMPEELFSLKAEDCPNKCEEAEYLFTGETTRAYKDIDKIFGLVRCPIPHSSGSD